MVRGLSVLVVLATCAIAFASGGWSVTPPAGWTVDATAGTELAAKTKAGFFGGGLGVDVDGQVYRSPTDPENAKLVVQVIHIEDDGEAPDRLVDRWIESVGETTQKRRRTEGGSVIA